MGLAFVESPTRCGEFMRETMSVRIRPMAVVDLAKVLSWRNEPGVRRCMITQHELSMEEHRRWFDRTSGDATRQNLIVEEGEAPLGVAQFSGVTVGGIAEWGFYLVSGARPGAGRTLGVAALGYAFGTLQLHKVCGQVLEYNERSIRFHERLGFVREGVLRKHVMIDGVYHDLVCFGLLRTEHESYR